jgi:hypothetical protein
VGWVGGIALLAMAVSLVHLAARPLSTDDFWWHLKMGEIYATQGLALTGDPISHTATRAPDPHQWLFGVAVYGAERVVGLQGLRVIHALAVCGILALAFGMFRRAAGSMAMACLATSVFGVMTWWRLFQFRPDLLSIAIALAVVALLLEPRTTPSWRRVAVAVVLMVVWANAHTLFAIGPALIVAALLGIALRTVLARICGVEPTDGAAAAPRLAAALGLIGVATLLNPRGIAQHLTFFTSAGSSALWQVRDEWAHFDPFDPSGYGPAMSGFAFALTDAVILAFMCVTVVGLVGLLRRRDAQSLRAFDPVGFGLGLAGLVALLVAVRFMWMGAFAILYIVRAVRAEREPRPLASWGAALVTIAIVIGLHFAANYRAAMLSLPQDRASYFANAYDRDKYYGEGVEFLHASGLEGRLFNAYGMGGFAAYWLSPTLRTFVDGRMNFELDVLGDYKRVTLQRSETPVSEVLDGRGVDVFFGVGMPTGPRKTETALYTTTTLEREPDWLQVSRSMRHAIYLRKGARNRANLERVVAYYAAEGVPFDAKAGLDVSRVIAERPDWASRHNLLPGQYAELLAASRSQQRVAKIAGLDGLALTHVLAGAYREALAYDRASVQLQPRAKRPLQRSVFALLRLDRPERAVETARRLLELDPADPRSAVFESTAQRYLEASRQAQREGRAGPPSDALIHELPLMAD